MKIGIITLLGDNYGNRLQNYAVQEILKLYAEEVRTIRYEKIKTPEEPTSSNIMLKIKPAYIKDVICSRLKNIYHLNVSQRSTLGNVFYFLNHKKEIEKALELRKKNFADFDSSYISYEDELLHIEGDDKEDWLKSYDAFVCGSDQIWNPTYPTASRLAFLQFAPYKKRISFSASLGITDSEKFSDEMRSWIKEIPALSVRESEGAKMVEEMTGRTPTLLLDPTMLLPIEKWERFVDRGNANLPGKYALCYFLGNKDSKYEKYISLQLKEKHLGRVELLNSEYPEFLSLAPQQMVYAIKNADIVYTDSFHGVVFSILYHKPFVVFTRREQGTSMNSRLSTILHRFGLENRMYRAEYVEKPIDYSATDMILKIEREKAAHFLETALHNIVEEN